VSFRPDSKVRYVTWPTMLYILAYSMPIRDMTGIDTPVDALLASSIIAIPSFLLGFLIAAVANRLRKAPSKTWVPNLYSKRGAAFVVALLTMLWAKAIAPETMLAMIPAFFAMCLIAGKWRKSIPGDGQLDTVSSQRER